MQNQCFGEESGTFALCKKVVLEKPAVVERTRNEPSQERKALGRM